MQKWLKGEFKQMIGIYGPKLPPFKLTSLARGAGEDVSEEMIADAWSAYLEARQKKNKKPESKQKNLF